jgi:hypothetical protein
MTPAALVRALRRDLRWIDHCWKAKQVERWNPQRDTPTLWKLSLGGCLACGARDLHRIDLHLHDGQACLIYRHGHSSECHLVAGSLGEIPGVSEFGNSLGNLKA